MITYTHCSEHSIDTYFIFSLLAAKWKAVCPCWFVKWVWAPCLLNVYVYHDVISEILDHTYFSSNFMTSSYSRAVAINRGVRPSWLAALTLTPSRSSWRQLWCVYHGMIHVSKDNCWCISTFGCRPYTAYIKGVCPAVSRQSGLNSWTKILVCCLSPVKETISFNYCEKYVAILANRIVPLHVTL